MTFTAVRDVEQRATRWSATGPEPWLRCAAPACAGRWLRIDYSSGHLDPLRRPVLRFVVPSGFVDEILPAAIFGRAFWVGRAPEHAREIWISPTFAEGPFAFRIDEITILPAATATHLVARSNFSMALRFGWGMARGSERWGRLQARRALGATSIESYDRWRSARLRGFEPDFDAGLSTLAKFPFLLRAPDAMTASALADAFMPRMSPPFRVALLSERPKDNEIVVDVAAGDRLAPHALAAIAELFAREPGLDVVYADEDSFAGSGRVHPRLKPDFSPIFAASGYLGAPLAIRGVCLNSPGFDITRGRAAHARRVLLTRDAPVAPPALPAAEADIARPASMSATILIPTRDHVDLLRACLRSLERHDPGVDFELLVLDNGSDSADALEFMDEIDRSPNRRVLRHPGPFNYSAICNAGAAEARAPFLVFLNNDVEALGAGWLARLLAFAARADVGAVGPKLLYPDGRLQHGGVTLGIDGFAAHMQRLVSADDPGYLGGLLHPREVSAVTGACLAVEARKFWAVGGFDAKRLPVEYSDVDLCLRLNERGWKTVFEPRARLMHRESATRGQNPRLDFRYEAERNYFRDRWARILRDDPYFHPALSLDALDIALG